MPQKTKKFLITTELHEVTRVRRSGLEAQEVYCPECHRFVKVVTSDPQLNEAKAPTDRSMVYPDNSNTQSDKMSHTHFLVCQSELKVPSR
jgi:uncharacterized Zn finger protein (UPF0148 family)